MIAFHSYYSLEIIQSFSCNTGSDVKKIHKRKKTSSLGILHLNSMSGNILIKLSSEHDTYSYSIKAKRYLNHITSLAEGIQIRYCRTGYRDHISRRQTPGLTRGSPPHLLYKRRLNPGLNPGLGVLIFGPRTITVPYVSAVVHLLVSAGALIREEYVQIVVPLPSAEFLNTFNY
jgi:hypothetical protein